eukprot:6542646-Pyramimonas_sp.AAC.1
MGLMTAGALACQVAGPCFARTFLSLPLPKKCEIGNSKCPDRESSRLKVSVPGGGVNCTLPGPHRYNLLLMMSTTALLRFRLRFPQRAGISESGTAGAL